MRSASSTPRILYICEECALGTSSGSQVRCFNIIRALQQIGRVEALLVRDPNGHAEHFSKPSRGVDISDILETQPRPNVGLTAKLKWTFDPAASYPRGYGICDKAFERLVHNLNEFDLIWFFKQRCAALFPHLVWRRSVLDIDDVLSGYERTALGARSRPLERLLTLRKMVSWQRRERLLGTKFTVLSVCSAEDEQYLRRLGVRAPIHVIPNGFEAPCSEPVRCPVTPPRIGFIGLLDYFPNRDAIHWFVSQCWPRIKCELPEVRLRMVGAGTNGPLGPTGVDIDGLGWIPDPSSEIQTWSAMVVPIRVGGGTRVKIAHGFSQKCPIVSTSLGAHGYGVVNGRELYLADSPEAFSNACIKAVREPNQAAEMAGRAWREFLDKWTWDAVCPRVWATAEECLKSDPQSQPLVRAAL